MTVDIKYAAFLYYIILARRKMASNKMKQIRKNGSYKEAEELNNEDNEELFADIRMLKLLHHFHAVYRLVLDNFSKDGCQVVY